MENIVNLEQLDYRDKLIKEYIDEKVKPEPTPVKAGGEIYYDYATWQKSMVKHGANVISCSASGFDNQDPAFLLEIGKLSLDNESYTYNGTIKKESLLQFLDLQDLSYDKYYLYITEPIWGYSGYDDFCTEGMFDISVTVPFEIPEGSSDYPNSGYGKTQEHATPLVFDKEELVNYLDSHDDLTITLTFKQEWLDEHEGEGWKCPNIIYACVCTSAIVLASGNEFSGIGFSNRFLNIYSKPQDTTWTWKTLSSKTVRVKYHMTEFSWDMSVRTRKSYRAFENDTTTFNHNENGAFNFLKSVIGDEDRQLNNTMIRRVVQDHKRNFNGTPHRNFHRNSQLRWIYKPQKISYWNDNDERVTYTRDYKEYILQILGIVQEENSLRLLSCEEINNSDYYNLSQIKHIVKRSFPFMDYRNRRYFIPLESGECKGYIDFLYGGICQGKTTNVKAGESYEKLYFTKRPQIIRIQISYIYYPEHGIDKRHITIKSLGNIDPPKIPF